MNKYTLNFPNKRLELKFIRNRKIDAIKQLFLIYFIELLYELFKFLYGISIKDGECTFYFFFIYI